MTVGCEYDYVLLVHEYKVLFILWIQNLFTIIQNTQAYKGGE